MTQPQPIYGGTAINIFHHGESIFPGSVGMIRISVSYPKTYGQLKVCGDEIENGAVSGAKTRFGVDPEALLRKSERHRE